MMLLLPGFDLPLPTQEELGLEFATSIGLFEAPTSNGIVNSNHKAKKYTSKWTKGETCSIIRG